MVGIRVADLPDLGAASDACSFVSEHAGSGRILATALRDYVRDALRLGNFGGGPVPVTWLGAVGDGSTDDGPAIAAAYATHADLWFPVGTYYINTNTTIGTGKRVRMVTGASFNVASGKTLTIYGLLDAGVGQIFSGTGTVVGLREARPEWWGAQINTPLFDSQPAMQAAHTCVQGSLNSDGGRPTILLGAGSYYTDATWLLQPTANCQLQVIGEGSIFGGSRIVPMAGFPAAPVVWVDGQTDAIQMITDFVLRGFAIIGGAGSPNAGLRIGRTTDTTHRLIGLHQSLLEDVHVDNINIGILLCHVRQIAFNRCSVWNNNIAGSTCVEILEAGWFAGDLDFIDCELVGNGAANSQGFVLSSPNSGGAIAGIRFRGCYTSSCDRSFYLTAGAGGCVHDIWIDGGTQMDFCVAQPIYAFATGAGSYIRNLQIEGAFIDGGSDQITLSAAASGQVLDTKVSGNWIAQGTAHALIASGAVGVTCGGNTITDNNNTTGPALQFTNCMRFSCPDNVATHTTANFSKYLVQTDGTSDYFAVLGNIGAGIVLTATVNDTSSGTHKAVANNV